MLRSKENQRRVVVLCVLLDLFAVSLIVPLLPVRLRELGVSQRLNGVLGSIYSAAQIVGGLILGFLSDRDIIGRRGLLLLSFFGAAIAYSIVGTPAAGVYALAVSRVLVGLCKQTMTASTAILSELTERGSERTLWIGRQSSAAQMSWIAGQSIGGILYARGDPRVPAVVAVLSYAICTALVLRGLPTMIAGAASMKKKEAVPSGKPGLTKTRGGLRALATSRAVLTVATARLSSQFVSIAANNGRALYELDRWHLTRADVAYLNSFKSAISVLSSWRSDLVVKWASSNNKQNHVPNDNDKIITTNTSSSFFWPLIISTTILLAITSLLEALPGHAWDYFFSLIGGSFLYMKPNESPFKADASPASLTKKALNDPSLLVYAIILFPINAAARQVLSIALRSRFTEVVPRKNTASALAALDVALSAVGVVSPIVGGFLLDASGGDHQAIDSYTLARQPLIVASLNAISALLFAGLAFFASSFSQEKKEFLSSQTSSDSSGGPGPSVVSFSFLPSTSSPSDRKTTVATNKYHKDVDHDNEGADGYALCAHDDRKVKHL